MEPALHAYYTAKPDEEPTKESAIQHLGVNDLYVALANVPQNIKTGGVVNVQVYYNPLIGIVWIGVAVMVLGGIVAIAEKSERSRDA